MQPVASASSTNPEVSKQILELEKQTVRAMHATLVDLLPKMRTVKPSLNTDWAMVTRTAEERAAIHHLKLVAVPLESELFHHMLYENLKRECKELKEDWHVAQIAAYPHVASYIEGVKKISEEYFEQLCDVYGDERSRAYMKKLSCVLSVLETTTFSPESVEKIKQVLQAKNPCACLKTQKGLEPLTEPLEKLLKYSSCKQITIDLVMRQMLRSST